MIHFLKKYFLKRYITEHKQDRHRELVSLPQAKTIGILSVVDSEDTYKELYTIFSSLQNEHKTVRLVAYIKGKEVPHYCLTQLTADFFCDKNLNWYGKPLMVQVDDFMKLHFDMLIDFTSENYPVLSLILELSKAKFIVGANPFHKQLYDLYIEKENQDRWELLKNIDMYSRKLMGENDDK